MFKIVDVVLVEFFEFSDSMICVIRLRLRRLHDVTMGNSKKKKDDKQFIMLWLDAYHTSLMGLIIPTASAYADVLMSGGFYI